MKRSTDGNALSMITTNPSELKSPVQLVHVLTSPVSPSGFDTQKVGSEYGSGDLTESAIWYYDPAVSQFTGKFLPWSKFAQS